MQATVRKMSIDEAERLALDIVSLASEIAKGFSQQLAWVDESAAAPSAETPRTRKTVRQKVIPLFALHEA